MSRGRVAILVENLSVPFDRRVWQECRSLTNAGYDVSVVCPQGTSYDTEPVERRDGVAIHRYPLKPATGGARGYAREYAAALWHTRRLLGRIARDGAIDVVHACNPPDVLLLAARRYRHGGTRFIFDHHDLVPELYLSRFSDGSKVGYRATLLAERMAFAMADVVITTNETYRQTAIDRCGVAPDDIFVVRSAPDLSRFVRVDADASLRRGTDYLIAYVGVMGPQDGVDYALRALAELRARRVDWHAVFVGSGDCFEPLRSLCSELGLDDFVEFTGRVPNEDLLRVISTADVCLAPDPCNPLNDASTMNKIVEYMTIGCPIVSFDLRESRASAGEAAVYVGDNDTTAFAAAIDQLLSDPERRTEMSEIGRRRAQNELSWPRSEASLLRAYEHALRQPHPVGREAFA